MWTPTLPSTTFRRAFQQSGTRSRLLGRFMDNLRIHVYTTDLPLNRRKSFGAIFSCSARRSLTQASKVAGLNFSLKVSRTSWVMLYSESSADHVPTPASGGGGFRPSAGSSRNWHRSSYTASSAYSTFIFNRLSALRMASAAELAAISLLCKPFLVLDTAEATCSAVREALACRVWSAKIPALFPTVLLGMVVCSVARLKQCDTASA